MHLPKCAGTAARDLLIRNYGLENIFPERYNCLDQYTNEQLKDGRVFSGHYDAWNIGLIPNPKYVFTILRDPKERLLSLYTFWKSHTWETIEKRNLGGPRLAKTYELEDLLASNLPGVNSNFNNVYIKNALGIAGCHDIDKFIQTNPGLAIKKALRFYNSLDYVGFQDSLEADFRQIGEQLEFKFIQAKKINVTSEVDSTTTREKTRPPNLSTNLNKLIEHHTELDRALYDLLRIIRH